MAHDQELQVQQKREADKSQEPTMPLRHFLPDADIFETEQALTVVLEMPGVDRENMEVTIEDNVLSVEGRVDFSKYAGLQPIYSEYNIGNYARSFRIASQIDQSKISAEVKDGVMTLTLPKAESAKPRRIKIG